MTLIQFAMMSGVLQALGYAFFNYGVRRHGTPPNPASWVMWAYGTLVLSVLEFDRYASWTELVLPAVCILCSSFIAITRWREVTNIWPEDKEDRFAFVADLLITAGYIIAWVLALSGWLSNEEREVAALIFLVCSNATTLTSFVPQWREVRRDPSRQIMLPWATWAMAYATLAFVTGIESGWTSVLMIYPLLNVVVHAITAWFVRPSRRDRLKVASLT